MLGKKKKGFVAGTIDAIFGKKSGWKKVDHKKEILTAACVALGAGVVKLGFDAIKGVLNKKLGAKSPSPVSTPAPVAQPAAPAPVAQPAAPAPVAQPAAPAPVAQPAAPAPVAQPAAPAPVPGTRLIQPVASQVTVIPAVPPVNTP